MMMIIIIIIIILPGVPTRVVVEELDGLIRDIPKSDTLHLHFLSI